MCRDTIRAALRSITACSAPNCASSAGSISSPPRSAARRARPTARPRPGPSRPRPSDWQTRTSYDFLRFEDLIQRDLAAPIWRTVFHGDVDLLAAGVRRHHRAVLEGALAVRDLHHLPAFPAAQRSAVVAGHRVRLRQGLEALGIPGPFSIAAAAARVRRRARHHAEIHRKPDLSALSAVRHDLDLGILAPPAAGMGPAHRPLRAASRQRRAQQRRRGDRDRRPQFGIVPGRRDPGARAQARSRSRPARPARRAC